MWKKIILIAVLVAGLAVPAMAATDLGGGQCQQSDGQTGRWDSTSPDDAGCITEAEYVAVTSIEGLTESGLFSDAVDNGDGTVTVISRAYNVPVTMDNNPLDRPVSANPEWEPNAPTVGEVLYGRAHSGVHPI